MAYWKEVCPGAPTVVTGSKPPFGFLQRLFLLLRRRPTHDPPGFRGDSGYRSNRLLFGELGQSGRGRDYAAKHAEAVFSIQPTAQAMRSYADDLRARAVAQGRRPDDIKIIFALQVVVDESRRAQIENSGRCFARDHVWPYRI